MPLIFPSARSELEGVTWSLKIQKQWPQWLHDRLRAASLVLTCRCCCWLTWFLVCSWHRWHRRWHFFWAEVVQIRKKTWCLECLDRAKKKKKPLSDLMIWYFFLFHFPHFNRDTFPPSSNKSATNPFFSIMTHFDVVLKCDLPVLLGKCSIC